MRKINCIPFTIVIAIIAFVSSCKINPNESAWSSMNPLSIPLNIREEWYQKGNLVPNHSFEQCEILKNDSTNTRFKLSNWKVIGNEVQLTEITKQGIYDSLDAFQGTHAIKIVRRPQDVSDIDNRPEGVESDFIKVIPGNYDLYFDIRLKDIIPSSYPNNRFQTRIGEGIDIRLKFYDKDQKEISPAQYFEYVHKKIDNGFKGFAFSNYFYISNFNWGRVRGEAWRYPFSDGDVPDNCRYVKIFLGLACPGTMWIDNIDFHLSRWNFTPMERMDSFFHKKYALTDLLIPTPKSISNKQSLALKNKLIEIVYGDAELSRDDPAVKLLYQYFSKVSGDTVKITKAESPVTSPDRLQVILMNSLSKSSSAWTRVFNRIKDKPQGYFIRKAGNKIYLGANESAGWYYAACTLSQLIDYKSSALDYADITDYPDFSGRSALLFGYENKWSLEQNKTLSDSVIQVRLAQRNQQLHQQLEDIDFYASYKLNDLYSLYFNLSKRWWIPGDFYKKYFDSIGKYCVKNYSGIMHVAVQINPYFHFDMEQKEDTLSDSLKSIFAHGSEESFTKIINVLKPALDAGARTVMLCADDYVPHAGIIRGEYTLFNSADKKQFTNLAAAQDYLLNKLQLWLNNNYGHVRLEFVPPPYNNWFIDYGRGSAQTYFGDLTRHLDSSIVLVWTGAVIRSLAYDMADLYRVTELYKKKPMVWDNSPYARMVESANGGYPINYPLKSVMCDLFEPFDISYPPGFPSYINSHYYSNNSGTGEINKIKNMTFADFAWNTSDYNPDFSLFKALVRMTGEENARLLLQFNQVYFQLVAAWGQLKMDRNRNPEYTLSPEQKQKANTAIKELQSAFDSLSPLKNDELKKELKSLMNNKIDQWNELVQTVSDKKR